MSRAPTMFQVDRLDLSLKQKPWPFALDRRAEIDAYFAGLQGEKPALWNGRILLLHRQVVSDGVFRGDYLETDYASFAAWRDWGRPATGVHDCFAAAAILTADGACLLGEMGEHTFNAGRTYFPCGTPDPNDVAGTRVDLDASVARELKEETGCDIAEFDAEPGWTTVLDGVLIVQVKVLKSRERAQALRARMRDYLTGENQPELSDIKIVRSAADFTPAMPAFVTTFLAQRFAQG